MTFYRRESDPPLAISEWGWRYHHLGIPVTGVIVDEEYFEKYKFFHGGFYTSPFGIEWMRFEPDSPLHELIKTIPHPAFEVDNLDEELRKHNFKVISPPGSPSGGVRTCMIEYQGAPIELIEFARDDISMAKSIK
jgi:hypothetical protein